MTDNELLEKYKEYERNKWHFVSLPSNYSSPKHVITPREADNHEVAIFNNYLLTKIIDSRKGEVLKEFIDSRNSAPNPRFYLIDDVLFDMAKAEDILRIPIHDINIDDISYEDIPYQFKKDHDHIDDSIIKKREEEQRIIDAKQQILIQRWGKGEIGSFEELIGEMISINMKNPPQITVSMKEEKINNLLYSIAKKAQYSFCNDLIIPLAYIAINMAISERCKLHNAECIVAQLCALGEDEYAIYLEEQLSSMVDFWRYEGAVEYGRTLKTWAECRKEYEWIQDYLPEYAPKSPGGYTRMKHTKSKRYLDLKEAALKMNYILNDNL